MTIMSKANDIRTMFKEEKWTVAQIAMQLNATPQQVHQAIKKAGLKRTVLQDDVFPERFGLNDGVTIHSGSDSYPATIIEIGISGTSFVAQEDFAHVTEGSQHDGSAKYEYSRNENGRLFKVRFNESGFWAEGKSPVTVGVRRRRYDPHF